MTNNDAPVVFHAGFRHVQTFNNNDHVVGQSVKAIRPMTKMEAEDYGCYSARRPYVIELHNGAIIFAAALGAYDEPDELEHARLHVDFTRVKELQA